MDLVFATNNAHKLREITAVLNGRFHIRSLQDIGFSGDIPETGATLEANALQKAAYIRDRYPVDCFADDTGLEVDALDGRPGVYSARYAGVGCTAYDNVEKLLGEMQGKANRQARFRTVISLLLDGKETRFEGVVDGFITEAARGADGFGYDPIFQPAGSELTFAEMSADAKNRISHRGRATQKLVEYLLGLS